MATRRAKSTERRRVERKHKAQDRRRKGLRLNVGADAVASSGPAPNPNPCEECGAPVVCIHCKSAVVCGQCHAVLALHTDTCPNCDVSYRDSPYCYESPKGCMTDRTCIRRVH